MSLMFCCFYNNQNFSLIQNFRICIIIIIIILIIQDAAAEAMDYYVVSLASCSSPWSSSATIRYRLNIFYLYPPMPRHYHWDSNIQHLPQSCEIIQNQNFFCFRSSSFRFHSIEHVDKEEIIKKRKIEKQMKRELKKVQADVIKCCFLLWENDCNLVKWKRSGIHRVLLAYCM